MRSVLAAAAGIAVLIPAAMSGADAPGSATPVCGAHAGAPAQPGGKAADQTPPPAPPEPDWQARPPPPAEAILTGYGTGGFPIHTSSPRAQAFFDNGMQLGHAFAHKASVAAFEAAETADPGCAMCVWGEAWSRGPTINFGVGDKAQGQLAALADKAAALAKDGPPLERALTAALQLRYRKGGGDGPGDKAYARAMDQIARAHPGDAELAILAADAWMIPVANGYAWSANNADLNRAIALLQPILAKNPDNTGAIHFYIHSTEMDGVGERALPYAERLQALAPAASHLVHMPSHVYFWVGQYQAAVRSNLDAVAIDQQNAARLKLKGGAWALPYHSHNVTFGAGAAMMSGDGASALQLARPVTASPLDPRFGQMTVARAYFAVGHFADQAEVAALPDPGPAKPFVQAMWRYARGEAALRRGDAKAARGEAAKVAVDPTVLNGAGGNVGELDGVLTIARLSLEGRADMLEHRPRDAAKAFGVAAGIQDARFRLSTDPPPFWYPVRRSLADADLMMGRPADAEREAKQTLARWKGDPVTLEVLAKAEAKAGRSADAAKDLASARAGWRGQGPSLGLAGA